MDCLQDILREGGYIDMGIPTNATVEDSRSHRRRNYCVQILNRVEMEIENYKENWSQGEDISLWKNEKGKYKKVSQHEKLGSALKRSINSVLGIKRYGLNMLLQNSHS